MNTTTAAIIGLFLFGGICVGQHQKSFKDASILSEARYLAANGQFGSAYSQDDGVEFKEESDVSGNRRGSYSYVDPTGKRRTVTYTAGKDGFKPTGDHIPVAPVPVAPAPAPKSQSVAVSESNFQQDDDSGEWKDDTQPQNYQEPSYNPNPGPRYNPSPVQYNPTPTRYNPNPAQYNPNPAQYNPNPVQYNSNPSPAQFPSFDQYSNQYQPPTESTHRFYPPGKINLNRSPDGFTYTFNKV